MINFIPTRDSIVKILKSRTGNIVLAATLSLLTSAILILVHPKTLLHIASSEIFKMILGYLILWFLIYLSLFIFIRLVINFKSLVYSLLDKILFAALFGEWLNILITRLTYQQGPVVGFLQGTETYGWPFPYHFTGFIDVYEYTGTWQNYAFWSLTLLLLLFIIHQIIRQINQKKEGVVQNLAENILIWAALTFFTIIFFVFLIQSPLPDSGLYSSISKDSSQIDGKGLTKVLPDTQDFDSSVLQLGTFSISPDNQWLIYGIQYNQGGRRGLTFYRLADSKKFFISDNDIIEAAKKIPTVDMEYLDNANKNDYFQFFKLTSNWTSDSKKFYADLDTGIHFDNGLNYRYPVIVIDNNSTPVVTFEDVYDSGERYLNMVQEMKNLSCSDCATRVAFVERYKKVKSKLPIDLQNNIQYDARNLSVHYSNNENLAISSAGKAYYARPKDAGFDLVELDTNTGTEKLLTHFYVVGSQETKLQDIQISPNDKKLVLSIYPANVSNEEETYIVDMSQNSPVVYSLGKNIYYDKFWTSDSGKLYFSCPQEQVGTEDKTKIDRLCVFNAGN